VLQRLSGALQNFPRVPHLPCNDLKSGVAPAWRPIGASAANVAAAPGSGSIAEPAP
jgi:hypothetical protein